MVGADVVLRLREVDAGLAPVGRVDLGDERRRDLDEAHAALIGGGAEAGEIADDATAEGDDHVLAGHAAAGELGPHDLGVGDRLRLLAGHDRDAPVERLERIAVQVPDAPVGHEEAASGHDRCRPEAEEPRPDEHGVVARRTRRPQQRGARRVTRRSRRARVRPRRCAARGRSRRRPTRRAARVRRTTPRTPPGPGPAADRSRGPAPTRCRDRRRPTAHGGRRARRGPPSDPTAPPPSESTAGPRGEQLERHPLLDLTEARLAVLGEHRRDRLAEPLLDHRVDIDRLHVKRGGGAARCGRLPGAHEADADERRRQPPLQAIRSL